MKTQGCQCSLESPGVGVPRPAGKQSMWMPRWLARRHVLPCPAPAAMCGTLLPLKFAKLLLIAGWTPNMAHLSHAHRSNVRMMPGNNSIVHARQKQATVVLEAPRLPLLRPQHTAATCVSRQLSLPLQRRLVGMRWLVYQHTQAEARGAPAEAEAGAGAEEGSGIKQTALYWRPWRCRFVN